MSLITQMPFELYAADAVRDFRIASGFDLGTARAMAWMSQLAYETDRQKIADVCVKMGISLIGEPIHGSAKTALPIASTYALVLDLGAAVVVSFAGTDPVVLANWVSDFDIRRGDGGAAEGFSEALRAVEFDILARLSADRPVVVTGHSLGAALAALLAQRLREISRDVAAVYTFGMPRPGREDFAAAYRANGLAERTFRLVHGDDIVPTVAPSFLGFRHVGWYVPADTGKKFSQPAGEVGSDEPQFSKGISTELSNLFHHPFHQIKNYADQFRNVAGVLTGNPAAGTRTDAAGLALDLLPPRVRHHWPDQYIAACTTP